MRLALRDKIVATSEALLCDAEKCANHCLRYFRGSTSTVGAHGEQ